MLDGWLQGPISCSFFSDTELDDESLAIRDVFASCASSAALLPMNGAETTRRIRHASSLLHQKLTRDGVPLNRTERIDLSRGSEHVTNAEIGEILYSFP